MREMREMGEMGELGELGKLGQKKFDLEVIAATLAGKGDSLLFPVPCSLFPNLTNLNR